MENSLSSGMEGSYRQFERKWPHLPKAEIHFFKWFGGNVRKEQSEQAGILVMVEKARAD